MQSHLVSFIRLLRSHDVRISPAETLDAMDVAVTLGYARRERLRDGLATALAKTPAEEAVFQHCFDRFFDQQLADFASTREERDALQDEPETPPDSGQGEKPEAAGRASPDDSLLEEAAADDAGLQALLDGELLRQLRDNDRTALNLAMGEAAAGVGLSQIQMFTQKGQYLRRMLDAMGEEQIRRAIADLEQRQSPALEPLKRYRDILREQVRDYVARQYLLQAEGDNARFMDEILSTTKLSHLEQRYMHRVQELVRRMARKLAERHARKRRLFRRGRLDMGKTLRRGIANDGVMFNTYWRRVRKDKPQLLAICDVSGSVAAYAKFLLLFLYSLQDVLPRVRSFAFSSHLGEVSELFSQHPVEKAIELVNWRYGGATDYGSSLQDFAKLALDDINSNTTVIILGDARNNNGEPRLDILRSIYQRSRRVIWLNPESRRAWGTGDSEMLRYQSACHFAAECNNLVQLERVVDQLLKLNR
ncbi:VWA domain-containing protein [Haliea sp.]